MLYHQSCQQSTFLMNIVG